MPYPKEILYLFPALPYLPNSVIEVFCNDPITKSFFDKITNNRYHYFSSLYKVNLFTQYLNESETQELFQSFNSSDYLTKLYYCALINIKLNVQQFDETFLEPLEGLYQNLISVKELQSIAEAGETFGLFLDNRDYDGEIEQIEHAIRKERRHVCLTGLGNIVKYKEIERICREYPFLSGLKATLIQQSEAEIKDTIKRYFLQKINLLLPFNNPLKLDNDNKLLAQAFVDAIFEDNPSIYDQQTQQYIKSIEQKVGQQLKQFDYHKGSINTQGISDMFNQFVNGLIEHTDKIAEAYQFLQYTGFGSQSDFFLVDIYSAARHSDNISEIKNIFFGIFKPFYPILREYQSIGLYENNEFKKVIRTLIPLLIAAATFIAIAALLAPLGIPEIAFFTALIPSLLIGLGLASLYCQVKDSLYHNVRQLFYGGQYQLPEFQINDRMANIFGPAAVTVKNFYIELLKECQSVENNCASQYEKGLITSQEKLLRENNRRRLHLLLKEWHDIHENKDVTVEEVLKKASEHMTQVIHDKRVLLNQKVAAHVSSEKEGWKKLSEQIIEVKTTSLPTISFVSKLGMFTTELQTISNEEDQYIPVVQAANA